jgi:hypothetical protein
MKKIMIFASLATLIIIVVSCNNTSSKAKKSSEKNINTEVYYTSTMHPEIHSDKPGNCPKCGMELVKKEAIKSGL